ncbi:MAG: cell division protein FtsL [Succiniclasticum sp.]|jgi:cell division protein FtsL
MLARNYNYEEQWAVPEHQQETYSRPRVIRTERQRRIAKNRSKMIRRRLAVVAVVFFAMYGLITWRSAALHNAFINLDSLQRQESQLTAKNAELKIEVDGLKGPERITSIAEKQLGMSVARRNIYVKVN